MVNLILFKYEQIEEVLASLNLGVKEDGTILTERGEPAKCPACGDIVTKEHLGNIMPGSKLIFCDDPTCFAHWIIEHGK